MSAVARASRPVTYSRKEIARFRILFQNSGYRAVTGEPLDGVTISGKCRVMLYSGETFDAYDLGRVNHGTLRGRRIVDAKTGYLYLFDPPEHWISSLAYYYDLRKPFEGGHHLRSERAMYARQR